MSGSELVWLIVGAQWPNDGDFNNIQPQSIAVVPEHESSSPSADASNSVDTGIVIGMAFAVILGLGFLALISDGALIRRRRRAPAASINGQAGPDGDIELRERRGPDAQPGEEGAATPGEEAATAPGTRAAAWNKPGKTVSYILILIIIGGMAWALYYFLFSVTELEPHFAWFKPLEGAYADLKRVHILEAMTVSKFLSNLLLLAAVIYPEPFWLEARVYQFFSALLAVAYSILSVLSMVYLKGWSGFLRDNGENYLATKCLVGFWTELGVIMVFSVVLMIYIARKLLR